MREVEPILRMKQPLQIQSDLIHLFSNSHLLIFD